MDVLTHRTQETLLLARRQSHSSLKLMLSLSLSFIFIFIFCFFHFHSSFLLLHTDMSYIHTYHTKPITIAILSNHIVHTILYFAIIKVMVNEICNSL